MKTVHILKKTSSTFKLQMPNVFKKSKLKKGYQKELSKIENFLTIKTNGQLFKEHFFLPVLKENHIPIARYQLGF